MKIKHLLAAGALLFALGAQAAALPNVDTFVKIVGEDMKAHEAEFGKCKIKVVGSEPTKSGPSAVVEISCAKKPFACKFGLDPKEGVEDARFLGCRPKGE